MVVFSNKAYNAIIRESFDKDPVETGGILLGHILNNGVWIVMEVLPPGIKCIFERAYFEYDDAFVNYLAQSVANQYKIPLELLGLWHRHPGSMDVFSSTDDGTNTTFALQNPSGVISGLVNIDPQFRLTMYYMENPRNVVRQYHRPNYERIDVEVGNDIIPEEYFKLKYYDGEGCDLNPFVERSHTRMSRSVRTEGTRHCTEITDVTDTTQENHNRTDANNGEIPSWLNDLIRMWNILKRNKIISLIVLILIILSIFSFKTAVDRCKSGIETVISWVSNDDKKEPCISENEITLKVGDDFTLIAKNVTKKQKEKISWKSSKDRIATIDANGKVIAHKEGTAKIKLHIGDKLIGTCDVKVVKKEEPNLPDYKLTATELELNVNDTVILTLIGVEDVSEIKWNSTDKSVATVTNGEIVSKKAGCVKISATLYGKEYVCDVTVKELQDEDSDDDIIIRIKSWNDTGKGEILLTDKNYWVPTDKPSNVDKTLITFSSENTEIATVTDKGHVTPIAIGTTKIIVSYNGKEQDSLLLTIKEKK